MYLILTLYFHSLVKLSENIQESGWLFQVLEFCDQKTRANAIFICKRYNRILTNDASFRWRLERLHIEDGIYCTEAISNSQSSLICSSSSTTTRFKELYLGLVQKRMLWYKNGSHDSMDISSSCSKDKHDDDKDDIDDKVGEEDTFNIHVSVRFKPVMKKSDTDNTRERKVTLPLHQRLALIRHQNKLNSNSDALNILKEEGEWFKDKWSALEKENAIDINVLDEYHVAKKDTEDKSHRALSCGIQSIDCSTNNVVIVDSTKGLRNFNFDRVLSDNCKQGTVYETSAQAPVQDFINGINACCLVYGVTGSGKTYTMFGPNDSMLPNSMNKGIVPMACQEIFDVLNYRRNNLNLDIEAQVSLSYIEIFGSEICDLLRYGRPCCPNKAASQRFVLSGAAEYEVQSVNDVVKALQEGEKQKRKAATALNERSSRAHSIVMITLKQVCKDTGVSHNSTLFLADLGGCEQTKKSDIVSGTSKHFENLKLEVLHNGEENEESEVPHTNNEQNKYSTGFVKSNRMREAVYINLSLMALKSCVEALVSKSKYIPYSDSKLTMMLSTALGGNSKTSIIICAAQENHLIKETIAALKFGQSCRLVSNSLQTEKDFLRELIEKLDSQIKHYQDEIRRKERWIVREEKRMDTLAEDGTIESNGFGGVEVRKTTVLEGAETEHHCLSDLLRKKAELTGVSKDYCNDDSHRYGGEVGFGNAHSYGLGKKFNTRDQSDYRFGNAIHLNVPSAVKSVLGDSGTWKAGENHLNEVEEATLKSMKKRSRLVYSGLSA